MFDISQYIIDLDKFKIIKKDKWSGSCCSVSIVEEKNSNLLYVAKVFKNSLKNRVNAQKHFFDQLKIEHLLHNYPNIVRFKGFNLYNFYENENSINPTIIYEFITNGTLKQCLNRNNYYRGERKFFTNTKKQICMIGIAIAAHIIHENGIIHLDLKPDNILLDSKLYPKITDFGSARFFTDQHKSYADETDKGNPGEDYFPSSDVSAPIYTSPEILKLNQFNEKADVYSYSYILYEIVSEIEPKIECSNILELFDNIINGNRPDLSVILKKQRKIDSQKSLQIDELKDLLFSESDEKKTEISGFVKLISECWNQDPNKRPSFHDIIIRFLTDRKLLLPDVDLEEVNNYLRQFDNVKINFQTKDNSNNYNNNYDHFHFRLNYAEENLFIHNKSIQLPNKFDIPGYDGLDELCRNLIDIAADKGEVESCATVGYNLANGYNGFPKCIEEAVKYLSIAIEGGNPSAMNTYGNLLYQKFLSSKTPQIKIINLAKHLFKNASDLGNTFAMISYSQILVEELQNDEKLRKIKKERSEKLYSNQRSTSQILLTSTFSSNIYSSKSNEHIENSVIEVEKIKNNDTKHKSDENENTIDEIDDEDNNFENDEHDNEFIYDIEEEEEESINSDCDSEFNSRRIKWNEAMKYMKLAADNDNIIAIKLYNDIFIRKKTEKEKIKSLTKSTYVASSIGSFNDI